MSQLEFKDFIIRVEKKSGFSTLHNSLLRDRRLSFEARGCLGYALSRPDDWQFWASDLMKEGGIGRDQLYAILKELVLYGYMRKFRRRVAGGKFEWQTIMYEQSQERPAFVESEPRRMVCLLRCGPFYSIVITSTPKQFLTHFQFGNPYQIQALKIIDAGNEASASRLKKELDQRHQRSGADWFRLGTKDIAEVTKAMHKASKRPSPDNPTMVPPSEKPDMAARPSPDLPHTAQPSTVKPSIYKGLTEEEPIDERLILLPDDLEPIIDQASVTPSARRHAAAQKVEDEVKEIFGFWQKATGRKLTRLIKGSKRDRAVRARLKEEFSKWQIMCGIAGACLTPHNRGINDRGRAFNELELICRTPENLEGHIDTAIKHGWDPERIEKTEMALLTQEEAQKLHDDLPTHPLEPMTPAPDAATDERWRLIMDAIKTKLTEQAFETWLLPIRCVAIDVEHHRVLLEAPNQVVRDWVKVNYATLLDTAFGESGHAGMTVDWTIKSQTESRPAKQPPARVTAQASLLDLENVQAPSDATN